MIRLKFAIRSVCLLIAAGLGGCAANSYCAKAQPYDNARSIPLIQGTEGLKVPDSATAMRVPAETAQDAPYGIKVVDPQRPGKTKYQCLDQPPTMAPLKVEPKSPS